MSTNIIFTYVPEFILVFYPVASLCIYFYASLLLISSFAVGLVNGKPVRRLHNPIYSFKGPTRWEELS